MLTARPFPLHVLCLPNALVGIELAIRYSLLGSSMAPASGALQSTGQIQVQAHVLQLCIPAFLSFISAAVHATFGRPHGSGFMFSSDGFVKIQGAHSLCAARRVPLTTHLKI